MLAAAAQASPREGHGSGPGYLEHELQPLLALVQAAGQEAVGAGLGTERCSQAQRPVMELLHVSKSGGTTMCQLARLSGMSSRTFNLALHSLVTLLAPGWAQQAVFHLLVK
ncbi:uncharacterized protein HaLaN_03770 [Haematococcus lacustris]|uniref:Uncharacterized protein n=1 Tax=Haematococcus lacustris TaxID=44745 RepID=A0A699Z094_HAELA|nr:uncharacterized protein HaLaN_03770 [Haematococcus lacustris]